MSVDPDRHAAPVRAAQAKAYHEREARKKEDPKPVSEQFVLRNGKVVKEIKTPSGSKYSIYVGTKAECDKKGLKYVTK